MWDTVRQGPVLLPSIDPHHTGAAGAGEEEEGKDWEEDGAFPPEPIELPLFF